MICDDTPRAWELQARYSDAQRHPNRAWLRSSIHDTQRQAIAAMKRAEGTTLELRIVPLYAAITKGEK